MDCIGIVRQVTHTSVEVTTFADDEPRYVAGLITIELHLLVDRERWQTTATCSVVPGGDVPKIGDRLRVRAEPRPWQTEAPELLVILQWVPA